MNAPVRPPPVKPETGPLSLDDFLAGELAGAPFASRTRLRPGGLRRAERAYVALPCRCGHAGCPGWALVHDEPAAVAHFRRLFGTGPA